MTTAMPGLTASYFRLPETIGALPQVDFLAPPEHTSLVDVLRPLPEGAGAMAVQYTGQVTVDAPGTYVFAMAADEAEFYVDGDLVLDSVGLGGVGRAETALALSGGRHEIELRHIARDGARTPTLDWKGPDTGNQFASVSAASVENLAPASMTSAATGLFAEYFTIDKKLIDSANAAAEIEASMASGPDATGVVETLNYAHSQDPFWEGAPKNYFAARFTGELNVKAAGSYTLFLGADHGASIYLDGELLLQTEGLKKQTKELTLDLGAGHHDLKIVYFDFVGRHSLILEWAGPDTGGARRLIDGDAFSHMMLDDGSGDGMDDGHGDHGDGGMDGGMDDGHDDHGDGGMDGGMDDGHDDHGDGGGDGGMDDGHGGHDHGDTTSIPEPPPPGADQAAIDAWVQTVITAPEAMAHAHDDSMMSEHMAVLDLVPREEATHIAISDGDWFDPATWLDGKIPEAGAKVLIPETVSVRYDGESDASLFSVRVDGDLSFATDADTKILLDTMVVSPTGRLEIGTEDNPVAAGVTTDIVIANNGDIDTNWDPTLVSRGVISHGEVSIHGAEKTAFLKVSEAPMAGDTTIDLQGPPDGWQVGDQIVLTGTHKLGWQSVGGDKVHMGTEDEVVTITSIKGNTLTIDRPLEYDHDTPRDDLFAYVSNNTRNITFSSEDGAETALHHRGHVMFMHNDEVDVRYAGFDDLGRTDKSEDAFDVGMLDTVLADSNIKSRYPFHFHRTGVDDDENPAMAVGNVVNGSPGWGFVHHDSNAEFIDNVAFDIFGAAFAAEDGNETGIWLRNIAIKSVGIASSSTKPKNGADVNRDDNGRTGDGFFFAGRLVEAAENVAANTTNGFVWMTRGPRTNPETDNLDMSEVAYGRETVHVDKAAIQGFRDNEVLGSYNGLIVIKDGHEQWHDQRSVMDGFLAWETTYGADLSYTGHYTLKDFDLIGTRDSYGAAGAKVGLVLAKETIDMVVNGMTVTGFTKGVDLNKKAPADIDPADLGTILVDVNFIDVETEFLNFDPAVDLLLTKAEVEQRAATFELDTELVFDLEENKIVVLEGTKTDSLGSVDRSLGLDEVALDPGKNIWPLLQTEGYYETAEGTRVLLVEDLISDRLTGELTKMAHVIRLEVSDDTLASKGAVYNGLIDLDSAAAITADDQMLVRFNSQGVTVDVLGNDIDHDGDTLRVDGLTDARHGEVFLRDDGSVVYRPYEDYKGQDSFEYWATDGNGNYTKGVVTLDVWD